MPRLVGRHFTQAQADAEVRTLQLQLKQQDDPLALGTPGTIVRQSIPPGAGVTVGSTVVTWTATGVVVPAVTQTPVDEARQRLVAAGLAARIRTVRTAGQPGVVIDQIPAAGTRVARGAAVSIGLADAVLVPDVRRRTRDEAAGLLASARLRAEFSDDAASPLAPTRVSTQQPQAGEAVALDTIVRVGIATGVVVPNVIDATRDDARTRLEALTLRADVQVELSDAGRGTVVRQQPETGTRVARGTPVVVTIAVARGVVVPNLGGIPRAAAIRALDAIGLRAEATDVVSPEAEGTVVRQSPASGARVGIGSTVRIVLARHEAPVAATPPPAAASPPVAEIGSAPPPSAPAVGVARWSAIALAVTLAGLVVIWFFKANRPAPAPAETPRHVIDPPTWHVADPPSRPSPAATVIEPRAGSSQVRLEVIGRSIIELEIQLRIVAGFDDQRLQAPVALTVEERRLYE